MKTPKTTIGVKVDLPGEVYETIDFYRSKNRVDGKKKPMAEICTELIIKGAKKLKQ